MKSIIQVRTQRLVGVALLTGVVVLAACSMDKAQSENNGTNSAKIEGSATAAATETGWVAPPGQPFVCHPELAAPPPPMGPAPDPRVRLEGSSKAALKTKASVVPQPPPPPVSAEVIAKQKDYMDAAGKLVPKFAGDAAGLEKATAALKQEMLGSL